MSVVSSGEALWRQVEECTDNCWLVSCFSSSGAVSLASRTEIREFYVPPGIH